MCFQLQGMSTVRLAVVAPTITRKRSRNSGPLKLSPISWYYTIMNRAAVIEQLKATQETLGKLLAFLDSNDAHKFVVHLYQARSSIG